MKILIALIITLNTSLVLAAKVDLECGFYHFGEKSTMEFRQVIELDAFSMKPIKSKRNKRDSRLKGLDKNIIASFKDSLFVIDSLDEYKRGPGRNKFFIQVYAKNPNTLTKTALIWLPKPEYREDIRDAYVSSFFFPAYIQVQCMYTNEWVK